MRKKKKKTKKLFSLHNIISTNITFYAQNLIRQIKKSQT